MAAPGVNPLLGVTLHAIGGFASGTFYAPLKRVRRWAWESYWLVMGVAAWLIAPWVVAMITTPQLFAVLRESPRGSMGYTFMFGVLWGIGAITVGLTLRYLGMALGMAMALGFTMSLGTLVPPIFAGIFGDEADRQVLHSLFTSTGGRAILLGIGVCIVGIVVCGYAGMRKEAELADHRKNDGVREFAFGKGMVMAVIGGVLSACFSYGFASGESISKVSAAHGTPTIFANNAVLVVILAGGLTTNGIWCLAQNLRNHTLKDYVSGPPAGQLANYGLSALGGVIWYGQFFFYGMGTTKLGEAYDFSSWSLHMAFIIIFSNIWGLVLKEWSGSTPRTIFTVWVGIGILILSTVVIGYGNKLGVSS